MRVLFFSAIDQLKQITINIGSVLGCAPSTLGEQPRERIPRLVAKHARRSQHSRSLHPPARKLCPSITQTLLIITGVLATDARTRKQNLSHSVVVGCFCAEVFAAFDERWPQLASRMEGSLLRLPPEVSRKCSPFRGCALATRSLSPSSSEVGYFF